MPIRKIISGGQSGADRAGLDVAIKLNIPHGGWCPKNRWAEDGKISKRYHLRETASSETKTRTERNVRYADGTIIFTKGMPTGGSAETVKFAQQYKKPHLVVDIAKPSPERIKTWLLKNRIDILNIAGSRESKHPGIYQSAKETMLKILSTVNHNKVFEKCHCEGEKRPKQSLRDCHAPYGRSQ